MSKQIFLDQEQTSSFFEIGSDGLIKTGDQVGRGGCHYRAFKLEGRNVPEFYLSVSYTDRFPVGRKQCSIVMACDSKFFADLLKLAKELRDSAKIPETVRSMPFKLFISIKPCDVFSSEAQYGFGDGHDDAIVIDKPIGKFHHDDFRNAITKAIREQAAKLVDA